MPNLPQMRIPDRFLRKPGEPARGTFACPCCGFVTLDERPPGTYEICRVCGREDDPVQFADPDYRGGANTDSLREHRAGFELGPRTRTGPKANAGCRRQSRKRSTNTRWPICSAWRGLPCSTPSLGSTTATSPWPASPRFVRCWLSTKNWATG